MSRVQTAEVDHTELSEDFISMQQRKHEALFMTFDCGLCTSRNATEILMLALNACE